MKTRTSLFLLTTLIVLRPVVVSADVPEEWKKPALEVVGWFETKSNSWGEVSTDFDCQGVSAGILQWNIGKGGLGRLLNSFTTDDIRRYMPTYGDPFVASVNESKEAGLKFVRSLQRYKNVNSCNGNVRGASWTQQGKVFQQELSSLMSSQEGIKIQIKAADGDAARAWGLAVEWSVAKRNTSSPTFREFVFFYDTLNFNGTFWKSIASYQKVSQLKTALGADRAYREAIDWLQNESSKKYYQEWEASRNAELWRSKTPTEDESDLILQAYLLARSITKKSAIPFRLLVLSRRGTIVFNDGYVNRTHKTFPQLR